MMKLKIRQHLFTYYILGMISMLVCGPLLADQTPFSKLGYPETTVLYGPKASTAFYFKKSSGLNDLESSIHLEIVPSQLILKEISTITFLIGDKPVYSTFLKAFTDTIKVDFPFKDEYEVSGYIKLEIKSNLFLNDNECRDYDEPGLWLSITPNSYLKTESTPLPSNKPNWAIDQFIPQIENLVLSRDFSKEHPDLSTYLHYYFKKYQGLDLPIHYLEDSSTLLINKAIFLINGEERSHYFPENEDLGITPDQGDLKMIYKKVYHKNSLDSVFTSNLILTGENTVGIFKAIQFLFSKDLNSSAFTDKIEVLKSVKVDSIFNFNLKNTFSFQELGLETELSVGVGKIVKNIPLPNYLAQGNLGAMSIHLKINHKPINEGENAFINVYLNNILIKSFKLGYTGILEQDVSFKNLNLTKGSYLGIEYIYVPEGGLCDRNMTDFYAQISPKESFLKPQYREEVPLIFSSFPRNFSGKPLEFFYDFEIQKEEISALSDLVMKLNNRYESEISPYLPSFISLEGDLSPLEGQSNKLLISKNPKRYKDLFMTDQYIKFMDDFISFKSDEISQFFDVNYEAPLVYAQLFQSKKNKIMMISDLSRNGKTLNTTIGGIDDPFLTNDGNVLISNRDRFYFFDLRSNALKNQSEITLNQFEEFWLKFRLFIITTIIAFIVVLLTYIFNKSRDAKKKIEDARN